MRSRSTTPNWPPSDSANARSLFELQDVLRDGLTDRQWEALETAYSADYFEWSRETSGEEAAALLGVTRPTFNKHLRIDERTAFRMFLDRQARGRSDVHPPARRSVETHPGDTFASCGGQCRRLPVD